MKQYCLKILSKNEKSLEILLFFFFKHLKTKFNILQKSITTHNHKKIFTLLKSPHVNKTAQEQFEFRIFCKQLLIKSSYLNINLIFLKKVLTKLFQDISINLDFITSSCIKHQNRLLTFHPDNFRLSTNKSFKTNLKRFKQKAVSKNFNLKKNSLLKLTQFLNALSIFGEILTLSSLKQQIRV